MLRWLIADWQLKLVSLVVAVALWSYTSGQVRVERQVQVELSAARIAGLPPGLTVARIEPADFIAVVSLPAAKANALREGTLHPHLELPRAREAGAVELSLTSRMLGLDSDMRVVRTDPPLRSIRVHLSRLVTASLPAEPPAVLGLPAGLSAEVRLDRTRVEVRDSAERLAAFEARGEPLRFAPIRLDGLDPDLAGPREERVALHPLEGLPQPIDPVLATVVVAPARRARAVLEAPVALLLPARASGRWRVEPAEPTTAVRVEGLEAAVRALRAADLVVWADLRHEPPPGPLTVPVQVQAPPGLRAVAEPVTLRIAAQPEAAAEAGAAPVAPPPSP